MRLLRDLWGPPPDYTKAIAQLKEATQAMDASRDYIIAEREELLDRLHRLEMEVYAIKIAVRRLR